MLGGNLNLFASEDGVARCRVQWRSDAKEQWPQFFIKGDKVCLKANYFSPFIGQQHAYIVDVYLPPRLQVDISMSAGTVYLEGVKGPLAIRMIAGDVQGYAYSSVDVSVSAGNIRLHGLCADTEARVKLGNVQTAFADTTNVRKVSLTSFAGDVKARFPQGFFAPSRRMIKESGRIQNAGGIALYANVMLGDVYLDDYSETKIKPRTR
jgi:hypothetical protein